MRLALTSVLLGISGIVAFAGAVGLPSVQAKAPGPFSAVFDMSCEGSESVAFVIPSLDVARAKLAEQGVLAVPEAIWIDLSLFDNGFVPGTFVDAGPFRGDADGSTGFAWYGVQLATRHYYRLNVLAGGRWTELARGAFETPDCVVIKRLSCNQATGLADITFHEAFRSAVVPSTPNPVSLIARWFDISVVNGAFAPGTFLGWDETALQPYVWEGLLPNRRHYYRTNWLYSDGAWYGPQSRGTFLTPDCEHLPPRNSPL